MPLILNGTTGISGVDGSAGTPSYQGGDTNTGIFYPAADTIAFAEGGTEVMRIDSSGNVGIGTSSPSNPLTVRTSGTSTSAGGNIGARIESNGSGYASTLQFSDNVANSSYISMVGSATAFGQAGTERMRIDSSGNVGIGTSSPSSNLEVYGASSAVSRVTAGTEIFEIRNTGSEVRLAVVSADPLTFRTSNVEAMRIDSSGRVCINTSSAISGGGFVLSVVGQGTSGARTAAFAGPDSSTDVGGTGPLLNLYNSTNTNNVITKLSFAGSGGTEASSINGQCTDQANNYGQILFVTRGSGGYGERMRITSGGDLLVGTTTSRGVGTFFASSGNAMGVEHSGNGTVTAIEFRQGAPSLVCGSITMNSAISTAYNTSSDHRLKENIAPMTGALDKVAQLKPVTYTWKLDGSAGQGFIAHELQAVVPDCVTGEKDAVDKDGNPEYQGVDTSFLVATLTAAIQEQQAMIEELKQEVAALKAK